MHNGGSNLIRMSQSAVVNGGLMGRYPLMQFSTKNNDGDAPPTSDKKTKRVSKKKPETTEATAEAPVTPKKRVSKKAKEEVE